MSPVIDLIDPFRSVSTDSFDTFEGDDGSITLTGTTIGPPSEADTNEDEHQNENEDETVEHTTESGKKPAKKRKSWGQELPTPKTNLPPR